MTVKSQIVIAVSTAPAIKMRPDMINNSPLYLRNSILLRLSFNEFPT